MRPPGRRGFYTSWIQTTATAGLLMSLLVILVTRGATGEATFAAWGWRIPFLGSVVLLAISLWIRLQLAESPAFAKMKAEGGGSRAPLTEAFGTWRNARIALTALFGVQMGQAVTFYTASFYSLFFLQSILMVDGYTTNLLVAYALALTSGFFVVFGLAVGSDRPQAGHDDGMPARRLHLLPDLPSDDGARPIRRWRARRRRCPSR